MTKRQLLVLRGGAAAAVSTFVAALSHSWAGGALPAPLIVVALSALLVFPGMALMGSRQRRGRVAVAVPVLQVMFHGVFSALGSPVGVASTAAGPHHGHEHAGAWQLIVGAASAAPLDGPMLAAHVAAAAVTFGILAYGERAILAVLAWVSGRSAAWFDPPLRVEHPLVRLASEPRSSASSLGGRLPCPRGPPRSAA